MKIIHTGDIHLESKMHQLSSKKAKERQKEIRDAFFGLIDYANVNDVKVILIAGDLFEGKTVKLNTLKELLSKISLSPDIDFLYLNGNHDDASVFYDDKVGLLPSNFKIFNTEQTTYRYGHIHIQGLDILNYTESELLAQINFNPNDFNILMLHGNESEIPLTKLAGKHIDYLALGDIHIPDIESRKLDARGYYGYCGILEPRGFDETGVRGFFLIDIENHTFKRTFIKHNKRTYHHIEVDITGLDNYTLIQEKINDHTKNISPEDIVRIALKGKYDYNTIKDLTSISTHLNNRFYFSALIDDSHLDYKTIDFENEISLRGEYYKLIQSLTHYDDALKEKLLNYGLKALRGEKIEL